MWCACIPVLIDMGKPVYIILNPLAGAGRGKSAKPQIISALQKWCGENYVLLETAGKGDAIQLSRNLVEKGATLLLVVGGDGTINEVVNGLLSAQTPPASRCELGIINCGSGAGVAQTLELPESIPDQVELIFNTAAKPIDAGIMECRDENGAAVKRFFVNECQAGFSAAVVAGVGVAQKRFGGALAFGMVSVWQLFRYEATEMYTRVDGHPAESQKMMGVVVGNGNYCAGGMQLTPGARPNDGLLDVLYIRDMNLLNRLNSFSKVYSGKHIHLGAFTLQRAGNIEIDSDLPVWIETDGELAGQTPCKINILPGAIWIRY